MMIRPFSEVEYAIVFLSQAYEGTRVKDIKNGELEEKKETMSTPNLMLEFGYMLNKLDKKDIKIVADFDYSLIKNGGFLFPSDMAGMFVDPKAELVYNDRIEEMIIKIWQDVKADLQQRKKIDKNVNVDKILTKKYRPNMKRVFAKEMDEDIDSYSLDKQYMKVWDGWIGELKEIDRLQEEDSKAIAASKYKVHICLRGCYCFLYMTSILEKMVRVLLKNIWDFRIGIQV